VIWLIPLVLAAPLKYRECSTSVGVVTSCSATGYNGEAVVLREGRFQQCRIRVGAVWSCSGSFTGTTPVEKDQKVALCQINAGVLGTCFPVGHSSNAVVLYR